MKKYFRIVLNSLVGLFYPDYCPGCGKPLSLGEHYICTSCIADLPYTYFNNSRKNIVSELMWGRIKHLRQAYSMCYFIKKSNFQNLLHSLKYEKKPEIGIELGIYLGNEMKRAGLADFDIILPVPLHIKKKKIRGYNQSEEIAKGIAQIIPAKIDVKSVERVVYTQTQTKKSKVERWENVKNIFQIKNKKNLENKHILIVDDVITTGATIEALSSTIERECDNVEISIASVAVAKKM